MNINNLGVMNSLSNIMNSGKKDSDFAIATYLVQNLYCIQEVSINRIVDEAFISRSAVRRFCNRLGYANFSDLKDSITKMIFPSNLHNRELKTLSDHKRHLNLLLTEMVEDINQSLNNHKVEEIVREIHNANKVLFLCANNTSGDLIRFQQELIYANKAISIISSAYTKNELIHEIDDDTLLITVSASGKFAETANEWIRELETKQKFLITGDRDPAFLTVYEDIYYISQGSITDDYLGIYGKYGITYLFDLISASYLYQYTNQ